MIKTYLLYYPIFFIGYLFFKITRKTWYYSYISFRRLFVITKGASNDAMSRRINLSTPPVVVTEVDGVLGKLSKNNIDQIIKQIEKNGYYVFDAKMDPVIQEQLINYSLSHRSS